MVKYADGPTTSVEAHIDAPPAVVWSLLCDINAPAQFSEEFQGAEWIDDGPKLGATFKGRNKHKLVGEWSVTCTITAFEEESAFEWVVGDPDHRAARWRFDLEPSADAGSDKASLLRFTSEIGPAPSGLTPAIERMPDREEDIVAGRMKEHNANMQLTVDGYKQLAEAMQGEAT